MLVTVAGSDPSRALALLDEPLWRVLWVYHHVTERDARRALERQLERVDAGFMTAYAFNQPATLNDELTRVRDALRELERGPAAVDDLAALRAAGEAMFARIERGRALSPEAVTEVVS